MRTFILQTLEDCQDQITPPTSLQQFFDNFANKPSIHQLRVSKPGDALKTLRARGKTVIHSGDTHWIEMYHILIA